MPGMPPRALSIGQVSARTGLAVSAIRFYADEDLIKADRSEGGNRIFERATIRRISFIAAAQKMGFSLQEIREELSKLPDNRTPNKADWGKIAKTFRRRLDERIAEIERLRDRLDGCIGCGCLSMKSCALYNANDTAADAGPGARFILEAI